MGKTERIIAFVPVRGGSKSIPLKNIKSFCGKPLMYWSLNALQESALVEDIYLATDSDEIEACATSFGFSKLIIYRREAINAQDASSTESVMLEFIHKNTFSGRELLLLVQATTPFLTSEDVTAAIDLFLHSDNDSLLSCSRTKRFFWNVNGQPINYDYRSRPRRQDFEGLLMENGSFYLSRIQNILESSNRLSGKIGIYEMNEFAGHEIDEPADWEIGEALMRLNILKTRTPQNIDVKLVLTDVDGVLTDAGMYYGENGDEFKKFNTLDGKGFAIVRGLGIKTGIITGENTQLVERRAKKIGADFLFQGVQDKLSVAKTICANLGIDLDQVAYIGDDIIDLELLLAVGLAACPANAVEEIRNIPAIIQLKSKGGDGAFRELVNLITKR
jgi:YrbI family 3-deoxy-D-manno-octulosonate 8-phosphate phosphatase